MPSKAPDYRDELYSSYRSTHFEGIASEGPAITLSGQIVPHLPKRKAGPVLEIGCGSGELLRLMTAAGYTDVSGVDVSDEQVTRAHELGVEGVTQGDLFDHLAAVRRPLDAIVAVDVLEHLNKLEILRALRGSRAALAPGGRLVARIPNAQSPFSGRYRYGDFTHETSFTQHSVRQVLRATGFDEVTVFPAEPVVHGPVSAIRLGLWKLIAAGFKFALAAETGIARGHIVTQNIVVVARVGGAGQSDAASRL